jgi:hypothetical protein
MGFVPCEAWGEWKEWMPSNPEEQIDPEMP